MSSRTMFAIERARSTSSTAGTVTVTTPTSASNGRVQPGFSAAPALAQIVIDRGIQVLIPPDASKRKSARPGWAGGYYAFMRRVLASERGG